MSSQLSIARSCMAMVNSRLREGSFMTTRSDVTTCYEPPVLGCGAPQTAFAKASFSIRRPINAEALSREITGGTAASGGLKPKANR
jgi:hypothetical protein